MSGQSSVSNPRRVRVKGVDGKSVSLASLPLVAYSLTCGHLGRDYAVKRWDILFCSECGRDVKVSKILAS